MKSELAGFYDPAPTDEEKHLVIRYLYQDQVHQVVIPDREPAKIPKTAHRISGR